MHQSKTLNSVADTEKSLERIRRHSVQYSKPKPRLTSELLDIIAKAQGTKRRVYK